MINKRKVAALGIGFGPLAVASIGLLPESNVVPPDITGTCGTACCSIITGHFTLGCTPIISKFDLSYGCVPPVPPYVPPSGGAGGGPYATVPYHTLQPHLSKYNQCERAVVISVIFDDDTQWRKLYAVNTCNDDKQVNIHLPNVLHDISISVSGLTLPKYQVAVEFKDNDK